MSIGTVTTVAVVLFLCWVGAIIACALNIQTETSQHLNELVKGSGYSEISWDAELCLGFYLPEYGDKRIIYPEANSVLHSRPSLRFHHLCSFKCLGGHWTLKPITVFMGFIRNPIEYIWLNVLKCICVDVLNGISNGITGSILGVVAWKRMGVEHRGETSE